MYYYSTYWLQILYKCICLYYVYYYMFIIIICVYYIEYCNTVHNSAVI
jgi:hypothetical protein